MKTFLNIIWHFPFFGFLFALSYALLGLLFCATIVGLPIGLGLLQFSKFLLWPNGNKMVDKADVHELKETEQNALWKVFALIVRILYFPFGLFAAIGCICTIIAEFVSIIGIPCGLVWAKSLGTIFNPVNKVCVPEHVALEIEKKKQERYLRNKGMINTSTVANANAVSAINSINNNTNNTTPPPIPTSVVPPSIPPIPSAPIAQIVASVAANATVDEKVVIPVPEEEITKIEEVVTDEAQDLSLVVDETIVAEVIADVVEEKEEELVVEELVVEEKIESENKIEITDTEISPVEVVPEEEQPETPKNEQITNEENETSSFGYVEIDQNEEIVYGGIAEQEVSNEEVEVIVEEFEAVTTTVVDEVGKEIKSEIPIPEPAKEETPPVVEEVVKQKEETPERSGYRQSGYSSSTYSSYVKEERKEEEKATAESPYSAPTEEAKKKSKMPIFIIIGVLLVGALCFVLLAGGSETKEDQTEVVAEAETSTNENKGEEPLIKQEDVIANDDIVDVDKVAVADEVEVVEPTPVAVERTPAKAPEKAPAPVKEPAKAVVESTPQPVKAEPVASVPQAHPAYGTKNYSSGTVYTGDFTSTGLRHGKGTYSWPSGDRYVGDWVNDNATGRGIYYSVEGWRYEGQFVNLKFHGQGVYFFASGKSRKGTWINGQMQK